jgi:hypothetical protein
MYKQDDHMFFALYSALSPEHFSRIDMDITTL